MEWAAVMANGRSPLVFTDRGIKINNEYYRENILKTVLKTWANKRFGDHGYSNRTQHHHTQHTSTKNGFKRRFLASFLPYNGQQNLWISIRWNFEPGAFGRVRFSLKNTKVSIIVRRRSARNWPKYRRATFVQSVMALLAVWSPQLAPKVANTKKPKLTLKFDVVPTFFAFEQ